MNEVTAPIITIAVAIIGVAILAVLVSSKSQTSNVLSAFGNMFSNMLSAAEAPVTGASATVNTGSVSSGGLLGGLGSLQMPGLQPLA